MSSILVKEDSRSQLIVPTEWLSVLLVGTGLLSVAFEAGRPWRARFVFSRLCSSWMSREALLAVGFILLCILQSQLPHAAFMAACGVFAAGFMVAQGLILYASRAVPAWNMTVVPPLIVVSGFYGGCGLNLINYCISGTIPPVAPVVALIVGIGDWMLWRIYRMSAGLPALQVKDQFPFLTNHLEGRVACRRLWPFVLIGLYMLTSIFTEALFLSLLIAAGAGVAMLIVSSVEKSRIILEIGEQRGICIDVQP